MELIPTKIVFVGNWNWTIRFTYFQYRYHEWSFHWELLEAGANEIIWMDLVNSVLYDLSRYPLITVLNLIQIAAKLAKQLNNRPPRLKPPVFPDSAPKSSKNILFLRFLVLHKTINNKNSNKENTRSKKCIIKFEENW